jgi:type VI secretion system protein ImpE
VKADLAGALAALQDARCARPVDAKLRVFLFQLLSVMGQWNRALTQLNVAGELDAGALPMVQTYREAIQCEALRAEIFAGKRAPLIFGEPQPWLACWSKRCARCRPTRRRGKRAPQAFEPRRHRGSIDGDALRWLADADQRLGPVLEAVVNGRYVWIPFMPHRRIEIDPPADLRDAVWTAATFTWTNGAQTVGLIPTRYAGSADADDAFSWRAAPSGRASGLGQRMFVATTTIR